MKRNTGKYIFTSILGLLLAATLALWCWNTLAGLFALPEAQFRHALAALVLLFALRWIVFPGCSRLRRRHHGAA